MPLDLKESRFEIVNLKDYGLYATHDMPCPVCGENKAMYDCDSQTFHPCNRCEEAGWVTAKIPKWMRWIAERIAK